MQVFQESCSKSYTCQKTNWTQSFMLTLLIHPSQSNVILCTLRWISSWNNLLKQVFMKIWSLRRWKLSYLSHATIWIISLVLIWMLAIAPAITWVDVHNTIGNSFVSFHWDPAAMSQHQLIKKFVQITWNNDLNFPASFASCVSSILECEGIQFCKRLTNTTARGMRSA